VENVTTISISHCTAGAPITVQAVAGQDPVIEGLLWLHSPSYWTINDIDVTWNPANTSDEHMVKMEGGVGWHYINSELWGAHSYAALLISDDNGVSPVTWTVADNCIHDTYQSNSTNQDQLIYANPGLGGSGGVVTRNLLFNATNGQGLKLGGPSSGSGGADYISVTYNTEPLITIASAPASPVIVCTMLPSKSSTTMALLCGLETKTCPVAASTTMRPNPFTGSVVAEKAGLVMAGVTDGDGIATGVGANVGVLVVAVWCAVPPPHAAIAPPTAKITRQPTTWRSIGSDCLTAESWLTCGKSNLGCG
jgi:hypothetical protein